MSGLFILLILLVYLILQSGVKEHYGVGAIGPYSYSTGAYAYSSRPYEEYQYNQKLNFRYLQDRTNW